MLFGAGIVVLLLVFFEIASYLACAFLEGSARPLAALQARQARIGEQRIETKLSRLVEERAWLPDEVIHPYLGYVRRPRGDTDDRSLGFAEGKDGELLLTRSPDRLIVLIVGGSVAGLFAESERNALETELPTLPRFSGRKVTVLGATVGGYKQPQQLMTLSYLLALGGEFDLVLNIDGFNEVALYKAENEHKRVAPVFPQNWYLRSQQLTDVVGLRLVGHTSFLKVQRKRWARVFWRLATRGPAPLEYSSTLALAWLLRDRSLEAELLETEALLREYQPEASDYVATGPQRGPRTDDELFAELAGIWSRSSQQIEALAEANGFEYFHFLQPNQYVAGSKVLTEQERATAYQENHPYRTGVDLGYPFLIREGRELARSGVVFEDLTGLYRDVEETVYMDSCCHVNARGNAILRERVMATLRSNGPSGAP